MPLTPSIGLSVLVHLIVLLISGVMRIFRSKRSKRRLAKRNRRTRSPALVSRFLGMLIPITISVVIFSGAFKLVELSLKNRFSSVHLAQNYISAIRAQEPDVQEISGKTEVEYQISDRAGPAISKESAVIMQENVRFDCTPLFNRFASEYGWSVVNYLASRKEGHSITDREKLAQELGVAGYDAGEEKNLELFKALYISNNETNISDPSACIL